MAKDQKYTHLTVELARMWHLKTPYVIPLVLYTAGIITNKLHGKKKYIYVYIYSNAENNNAEYSESFWEGKEKKSRT